MGNTTALKQKMNKAHFLSEVSFVHLEYLTKRCNKGLVYSKGFQAVMPT